MKIHMIVMLNKTKTPFKTKNCFLKSLAKIKSVKHVYVLETKYNYIKKH